MKKFNFRLEKVLQLRKFREEECKIALGQAISFLNVIDNKIRETAVKHHQAALNRFENPAEMASWDLYILRLEHEARQLAEQAAQAELVVEEKRALYMEASRELKAMEKLREKRKEEYHKEMEKYEMKEIDEITAARYARLITAVPATP